MYIGPFAEIRDPGLQFWLVNKNIIFPTLLPEDQSKIIIKY